MLHISRVLLICLIFVLTAFKCSSELTVTIENEGDSKGRVSVSVDQNSWAYYCEDECEYKIQNGSRLEIKAFPDGGSVFNSFEFNCDQELSDELSHTCIVESFDDSDAIFVKFEEDPYANFNTIDFTFSGDGSGSLIIFQEGLEVDRCEQDCSVRFEIGANLEVFAKPERGSQLVKLEAECFSRTKDSCVLPSFDKYQVINVEFSASSTQTITVDVQSLYGFADGSVQVLFHENIEVCEDHCEYQIFEGEAVTLRPLETETSTFRKWENVRCDFVSIKECGFNVYGSITAKAIFEQTNCPAGEIDLNGIKEDGCEYKCIKSSEEDTPDTEGLDSNCDGIDGDVLNSIFVDGESGNDENPGTRSMPVQSIYQGILLSQETGENLPLLVLSDAVDEEGNPYEYRGDLSSGISIFGGYIHNFQERDLSKKAIFSTFSGSTYVLREFYINDPTLVQSIRIIGKDKTSSSSHTVGLSCNECPGLTLSHVDIELGNTPNGADGAEGTNGANGIDGTDASFATPSTCSGPIAGLGGELLYSATGGDGADPVAEDAKGFDGARSPGRSGPDGGVGGASAARDGSTSAVMGGSGSKGPDGVNSASYGRDGRHNLTNRTTGGFYSFKGGEGRYGEAGSAGGGGGHGRNIYDDDGTLLVYGGAGGGGGSAGAGARGGEPGENGGSLIGLAIEDSSGLTLSHVTISTGDAGNGGIGGLGGIGGIGGLGGKGAAACTYDGETSGAGAGGGNGGDGGDGDKGGDGVGGNVIGILVDSSVITVENTTYTLGNPGKSGSGTKPELDGEKADVKVVP